MTILDFNLGFEPHDELNPRLWHGDELDKDIESALIKIAQDFKKFISVPFDVVDVRITGGQVSYFYTEHSDLDLHLVCDYSGVTCEREAAELFDAKRLLYKEKFDITVKGIPVELYVEDIDHPAVTSNYSVMKRQWIKKPNRDIGPFDVDEIEKMSRVWSTIIQHSLESNDFKTAQKTMNLLRKYRHLGLKTTGEYSTANLVYKTLRNSDLIKKLQIFINTEHDKFLSLGQ
jgi:hypothetical protein